MHSLQVYKRLVINYQVVSSAVVVWLGWVGYTNPMCYLDNIKLHVQKYPGLLQLTASENKRPNSDDPFRKV